MDNKKLLRTFKNNMNPEVRDLKFKRVKKKKWLRGLKVH